MKHFLDIAQLSPDELHALIKRAMYFKNNVTYPQYPQCSVVNMFYENSTRTRVSFELAAKKLAMTVINLEAQSSSESKGEAIEDTIKTLSAMGIGVFIIRHVEERLPEALALIDEDIHIVNAGDGTHAHPSQALLDFMTIMEMKPNLRQLKMAIVGNIRHSRVANSLQSLCAKFGVRDLTLIAPDIWQPETIHFGRVTASLKEGLLDADVVVCLRVQRERLLANEHLDLERYRRDYALTKHSLGYAKNNAMVLHPGPINRGVEIDSDVADGSQSYILQQVHNGVFIRMAILEALLTSS